MATLSFAEGSPNRNRKRERLVAAAFLLVLTAFCARLVQLQVIEHERWKSLAEKQVYNTVREPMPRGEIRDRHGMPLAVTLPMSYAIGFRPTEGINRDSIAEVLANVLPISENALRHKIGASSYTYLARRVDWQVQQQLVNLNLPGIEFVREARRSYPATMAAGTAVGFTNVDGIGQDGIERALDSLLSGDKRDIVVWNDARRIVPAVMSPMEDAVAHSGANVQLTIDLQLQTILDRCMIEGLSDRIFEKACAILLDPHTGEILGISTLPTFDPNNPAETDGDFRRCWPILDLFEPGSIFKIVTVGAGLDEGVVTPSSLVDCEGGKYRVPGKVLNDAHAYGTLSVAEVFAKSSNIGCAKIAERMTADDVYSWIGRFGFGARTEVGLLFEPSGFVPKPSNWSGPTRSNLAIGQGVSVTALQVAAAYAAIANGGLLMQPKLVKALEFPTGEKVTFDPVGLRPVIRETVAKELTRMMTLAVEDGTGKAAKIDGVKIAGKTGTAQKVNLKDGGYYQNRYVSSFAGFFPADNPLYVLLVVVDDPRGGNYYGGQISAPVFASITREILEARHPELLPKLEKVNEVQDSLSNDSSTDSTAKPVFVFDSLKYANVPTVTMPSLLGLPLRAAVERSTNAGLSVRLEGFGVVDTQFPPAGVQVPQGYECSVIARPVVSTRYASTN